MRRFVFLSLFSSFKNNPKKDFLFRFESFQETKAVVLHAGEVRVEGAADPAAADTRIKESLDHQEETLCIIGKV